MYFEAECHELTNGKDIEEAMVFLNKRVTKEEYRVKNVSSVSGEALWRIYKAVPQKAYKLTEETVNGVVIDKRVEIAL